MKTKLVILLMLLGSLGARARQLDSVAFNHLDSLLNQYYVAMMPMEIEAKCAECDQIISECQDSVIRQWVAVKVFEHYKDSPLMGEETVAVHVYDKWFASGEVRFGTEAQKFDAALWTDFNRSSLLYADSPVIEMFTPEGQRVKVPCKDTLSVLFFYDTSCAKCKLTSIVLPHTLDEVTYPVKLYALYIGSDPEKWAEFRSNFTCLNKNVEIIHLWDTQVESDYQRLYAVLATPRLFLVDGSGMIVGRRLEVETLKNLLEYYTTYYDAFQKDQDKVR